MSQVTAPMKISEPMTSVSEGDTVEPSATASSSSMEAVSTGSYQSRLTGGFFPVDSARVLDTIDSGQIPPLSGSTKHCFSQTSADGV